ncbi:hypothetical protein L0244_23415, partial [bacterium]|nr:hypothetical protein [bacterium]
MQDIKNVANRYALIPVALLLVVAGNQINLAFTKDLTPWKGGGFGMFSTTDGNMFRALRVFVSAPQRSEELLLKGNLEDLAVSAQMFPSDWLLDKLAKGILKDQKKRNLPVEKIEIDVWRLEFKFSCRRRGFCPSCSAKRSVLWREFVSTQVLADCP